MYMHKTVNAFFFLPHVVTLKIFFRIGNWWNYQNQFMCTQHVENGELGEVCLREVSSSDDRWNVPHYSQ